MTTPLLHVVAGPNRTGRSTLATRVLVPRTHLPFVDADLMAEEEWPGDRQAQRDGAHVMATRAAARRTQLIAEGRSFLTETVFSHPSKVDLVADAVRAGHLVTLHVVMVPVELSVQRVGERVGLGGHEVPEDRIRARHARLWTHVVVAAGLADRVVFYDNSRADQPFTRVAEIQRSTVVGQPTWPRWTPDALHRLTS